MTTIQEQGWAGKIGAAYTDRNTLSANGLDQMYLDCFGVTRADLNRRFLGNLGAPLKFLRILEVGCNIGMQLRHLQSMGFWNLHGVELQQYALDRLCVDRVETCQGSATDLPYQDESFDLVYTSGVLIHISPDSLPLALSEILRCTRRYVWGFEYFSEGLREIKSREWEDMLWSANYPVMFLDMRPGLKLLDWWTAPDQGAGREGTVGCMYLLEKA
jgi:pseudaminic acid biosynthesis-associated methylase